MTKLISALKSTSPIVFAVLLATSSLIFSLFYGTISFSPPTLWQHPDTWQLFISLRMSNTLTAFTTGGLLALSGTLMQLVTRNSLADPYLLGTSSGAGFFMLLFSLITPSDWMMEGCSWFGCLVSTVCLFALTKTHRFDSAKLVLTGISLATLFSAASSLLLLISPDPLLRHDFFWLIGNIQATHIPWFSLLLLLIALILCLYFSFLLNLMHYDEMSARSFGFNPTACRVICLLGSALLTATAVHLAGCIGFIGLVIPHIARILTSHTYQLRIPLSVLLGGTLLTLADSLAKHLIPETVLPTGLVMSCLGIPIFLRLLHDV